MRPSSYHYFASQISMALASLLFVSMAKGAPSVESAVPMPEVLLTEQHQKLCQVGVGDTMPLVLKKLAPLYGPKGTVVLFWKSNRRMTRTALADLGPDVVEQFGPKGIEVVGIAVEESAQQIATMVQQAGASFPQLSDSEGTAFASVGSEKLPRVYLLDPAGKILWFDLEYSLATRRELAQALRATLKEAPTTNSP